MVVDQVLDLSFNKITEIAGVASLKSLTHLNLSHNAIPVIKNLDPMTLLTHVDLSFNSIDAIDGLKVSRSLVQPASSHPFPSLCLCLQLYHDLHPSLSPVESVYRYMVSVCACVSRTVSC